MSSVTVSRSKETKEAAKELARRHELSGEEFLEAHPCRVTVQHEWDDGIIYIYKSSLLYTSVEWRNSALVYKIEDVKVESATHEGMVLHVTEPNSPPRYLKFTDMDRPDEVGRVIHFLRCWRERKMDPKILTALERIPLTSVYTRALMRYPQHHHDMWNIFGTHTVLHPPAQRAVPAPELPGDSSLDRQAFEAVLGHHMFWGLMIHELDPRGYRTGDYDKGPIKSVTTEMMVFLNTSVLSIHGEYKPMPLQISYTGILSIVEFSVNDDETDEMVPAIRIAYVSEDSVANIFILHKFETDRAFEVCLHEMTLLWAQQHNRNYNIGEAFPVLDNVDLMTIVMHFRHLDTDGYGIIPREDFVETLKTLDGSADFRELVLEMFDPCDEGRVQFSRYLLVMRTLLSGSVEDKSDLVFTMFDYQRTGWFERKELLWILSVMSQPLDPEVREGYTFRDFTRWLFGVMDKNHDGFVTHQEFVNSIRNDKVIQRAFRTMHLSPQEHHEAKMRRRPGRRFIFVGHPHWNLVCCLQRGIELAVSKLKFVREEPDIDMYEEVIRYDVETESLYNDPDIEWETSEPIPEWAIDFTIGTKVKLKHIEVDPSYNNKTGLITGVDSNLGCLLVYIQEMGNTFKVGPQNLQILRPAVKKSVMIHALPGTDVGLSFQRRPDGLVLISGVAAGSRAYHAGLKPGSVVESINHHRMPDVRTIEAHLYEWRRSGASQILMGLVVPDEGSYDDFAPGSRIQLTGLQNQSEFNGRCGIVLNKEGEDTQILLDDSDMPNDVQATNLIPLTNAIKRKITLFVPPGSDLGFDYESNGLGAVYVKSLVPKGPADRAGLPVRSVVTALNGANTPSAAMLTRAINEWAATEQSKVEVEFMQPGLKLNQALGKNTPTGSSSTVVVSDYCPRAFAEIRKYLGVSEEDYLQSVGLNSVKAGLFTAHFRGLWEMKPGAMWFATHDERFIINGMSEDAVESFMVMLAEYQQYISENVQTFLNKYVGLHSIRWNGAEVYFSVMMNVFPATHQIGQVINVSPATYPDWNRSIGAQASVKEEVLRQLYADVNLLEYIGASDYVLVIGIHNVALDDTKSAERRIKDAEETLLGNPSWSVSNVLASYKIQKKLPPTFTRKYFTDLPPVEERSPTQQHKARLEEKFSPKRARSDDNKENTSPNPPARSSTPPEGYLSTSWVCAYCKTINGSRIQPKANPLRNRQRRVTSKAAPACAGCYRTVESSSHLTIGDVMPLDGEPETADYVEQTYIQSKPPVRQAPKPTQYVDDSDASTEASGPDSPEKVPADVANSIRRMVFQREHGGYPGAVIHTSGLLSLVADKKSNLFFFAIVDTLNTNHEHGEAEAYAQEFKQMLGEIFV